MWYGGIPPSESQHIRDRTVASNYADMFNQYDSYRVIYNQLIELPNGYSRARLAAMIRYYLRFGDILN